MYYIAKTKKKNQLYLILAISSSLEGFHGYHSRDTLFYTVAQILIIVYNFCVVNTDYNLVFE